MTIKIATWNVNSLTIRLPQVLDWLAANPVDALGLQELKLTDEKFPVAELEAAGYRSHFFGQKTYNGVALLTRAATVSGVDAVVKNIPGFADEQARIIAGTLATAQGPCAWSTAILSTARSLAVRSLPTKCSGSRPCATGCTPSYKRTRNWCW